MRKWAIALLCASITAPAMAQRNDKSSPLHERGAELPDVRETDTKLAYKKGDFMVVPIPLSNPTIGSGLILGAAYFYSQTEQQKEVQPASVTQVFGMATDNGSRAYGIAHQSYWNEDKWRFKGFAGNLDLQLPLLASSQSEGQLSVDWTVKGQGIDLKLYRSFFDSWYLGVHGRYIDNTQGFSLRIAQDSFSLSADTKIYGIGAILEKDTRDNSFNPYQGARFELTALHNEADYQLGSNYQSYEVEYKSYHQLVEPLVLAWQVKGCSRDGRPPLWDSCTLGLRGFSATRYLSESSLFGQAEARWNVYKRLGLVGFAGGGRSGDEDTVFSDRKYIPSYGLGIRFLILESQRINLRLDYARSNDSDAWYLAVGEAF